MNLNLNTQYVSPFVPAVVHFVVVVVFTLAVAISFTVWKS